MTETLFSVNAEEVLSLQGNRIMPVVSRVLCGATEVSACYVNLPPGGSSKVHLHRNAEVVVVCLKGFAATLIGPELEPKEHGAGEFIFIPKGVVHAAVNLSMNSTVEAVSRDV
ncbi:cupin domain-containing protein [Lentzea alba]|uniref:cupin domain-containing protein n=1 Tax=Lentzea alba TaxID=2714351 RepID=UPI0039BEFABC